MYLFLFELYTACFTRYSELFSWINLQQVELVPWNSARIHRDPKETYWLLSKNILFLPKCTDIQSKSVFFSQNVNISNVLFSNTLWSTRYVLTIIKKNIWNALILPKSITIWRNFILFFIPKAYHIPNKENMLTINIH